MPLEPIKALADSLINVLKALLELKHEHDEEVTDALLSISKALQETLTYKIQSKNYRETNKVREIVLSGLWREAAIKVRNIDPKLAKLLSYKSFQWESGFNIPRREILENKIALVQISEDYKKLAGIK